MIKLNIGQLIPLVAQVRDGNSKLEIACFIYDAEGELLSEIELDNKGGGLYLNSSLEMPDQQFIIARYVAKNSAKYSIGVDIFYSDDNIKVEQIQKMIKDNMPKFNLKDYSFKISMETKEQFIEGDVLEEKQNKEFIYGDVI